MRGAAATRRGPWSQARPSIRAGHNLTSFTANTQLRNAARARSSDMLANGYFEHDGLKETWDARIARYLKAPLTGENIAWGPAAPTARPRESSASGCTRPPTAPSSSP